MNKTFEVKKVTKRHKTNMNIFIFWIILYSIPQYWLCWFGINIWWFATTAKIISLVVYWNIKFADMTLFEGNTNRVHFSHNIQRQSFLTWIVIKSFYCWLWFIIASMVRQWNTRWSFRNLEVILRPCYRNKKNIIWFEKHI